MTLNNNHSTSEDALNHDKDLNRVPGPTDPALPAPEGPARLPLPTAIGELGLNPGGADTTAEVVGGPAKAPPAPISPASKTKFSLGRRVANTVGAALTGAVDEVSDTVVNLGADIVNLTGLGGNDFNDWYSIPAHSRNPLKFGDARNRFFGVRGRDRFAFAETILQFGVGMLSGVAILKVAKAPVILGSVVNLFRKTPLLRNGIALSERTIARIPRVRKVVGTVGRLDFAGAISDGAFMDPIENNLFGVLDNAPESAQFALTKFIVADEDGPETVNRLRMGMQGFVIGRALERLIAGARAVHIYRRLKNMPAGSVERRVLQKRGADILEEAHNTTGRPMHKGYDVIPDESGTKFQIVKDGEVIKGIDDFATEAEAHRAAASIMEADKTVSLGPSVGEVISQRLKDGVDPNNTDELFEGLPLSIRDTKDKISAENWMDKVAEAMGHRGFDEDAVLAREMFGGATPEEALVRARAHFGERYRGSASIRGMIAYRQSVAQYVSRLSRVIDEAGEHALATDVEKLRRSLDTMMEMDLLERGSASETGRELVAQQAPQAIPGIRHVDPRDAVETAAKGATRRAAPAKDLFDVPEQIASSAETSINSTKLPAAFGKVTKAGGFKKGTKNFDIGGGKFDNATDALREQGVENNIFDPFNRDAAHNAAAVKAGGAGQSATVTINNVLNVIEESANITKVLRQAENAVADDGVVYISVYAGNSSGIGKATSKGFQKNLKLSEYVELVEEVFGDVRVKNGMIEARLSPVTSAADDAVVSAAAKQAGKGTPRAPKGSGVFTGMTRDEIAGLARHVRLADGDPDVLAPLVADLMRESAEAAGKKKQSMSALQKYRYINLLSGAKTHLKNISGMIYKTIERPMGYIFRGSLQGDDQLLMEGVDELIGLATEAGESLTRARKAWRAGRPQLDPMIARETGLEDVSAGAKLVDKLYHSPLTALMTEDEFFKSLNYRTRIRAIALRDGRELFANLPPAERAARLAAHVETTMDAAFTRTGAASNRDALNIAREAVLQEELSPTGKKIEALMDINGPTLGKLGAIKPLRFFFPFVKTPINMVIHVTRRTPGIWRFSKVMTREMSGELGEDIAEKAAARLQIGVDAYAMFAVWAAAGNITGTGPKNPEARRQLLATGWRPLSFRIPGTEKFITYNLLEPLSTMIGMVAAMGEVSFTLTEDAHKDGLGEAAAVLALAIAENATDKTFMSGLDDLSGVMGGSRSAAERFAASVVGQHIPFSGLVSQLNPDGMARELRGVQDRILSRIPYFSSTLEPRRNMFGTTMPKESYLERTVLPFAVSEQGSTEQARLMQRLQQDIGTDVVLPSPQETMFGEIDLTDRDTFSENDSRQSPLDRQMELLSTGVARSSGPSIPGTLSIPVGGDLPPYEDALRAMVEGDVATLREIFGLSAFQFMNWDDAISKNGVDINSNVGTRLGMVQAMFQVYTKATLAQVLKEFPKLAAAVKEHDDQILKLQSLQGQRQMDAFTQIVGDIAP